MEGHRIIAREPFIPKGLQRTPTILLVDDDKTICKLLEHHFKGSDCNLLMAHDGLQAL